MIEHCITSFKNKTENDIFRTYITDTLQAIANMYHKTHGGNGEIITKRYFEMIHPPKPKKEETAEDIIKRIKNKIGS